MSKTREVRRILKREKRDADQRLALERAAAAAASSRVGAQRRDGRERRRPRTARMGCGRTRRRRRRRRRRRTRGSDARWASGRVGARRPRRRRRPPPPRRRGTACATAVPSGRPRIPKHVQDRFAGGVRIGRERAAAGPAAGDAGGVPGAPGNRGSLPGVGAAGGTHRPADFARLATRRRRVLPRGPDGGARAVDVEPAARRGAVLAVALRPARVLVDTIPPPPRTPSQKPGGRGGASLGAKATEKLKLADALLECAVCAGTAEASKCQETLRCSRCALPAHPRCYGIKSVAAALAACAGREGKEKENPDPKGWLCWVCRDACDRSKANTPAVAAAAATTPADAPRPSLEEKLAMSAASCVLCPVQLGAFKQCADRRWCHVACAQWMPEISMDEADVCRAIRGVQQIPKERARHPCVACGRAGASACGARSGTAR